MLSSRVLDQPRSGAAVNIPHEVHPPFDRHELERAARRHMTTRAPCRWASRAATAIVTPSGSIPRHGRGMAHVDADEACAARRDRGGDGRARRRRDH